MTFPICYVTDHPYSRVMMQAFAKGCGARIVPADNYIGGDPAVVYGILRGCGDVMKQSQWVQRDFLHIDHAYFRRSSDPGRFDGHYRITRNGRQWQGDLDRLWPDDRFRALRLDVSPWREGRNVLVAPLSAHVGRFLGIDTHRWLETVLREVQRHTDRPVFIKKKDEGDIRTVLRDCHVLVTFDSMSAMEALLFGVPVCVLDEQCALFPLSTRLAEIETPFRGERERLFHALAYQQWTLKEIESGEAWRALSRARA